jgi:predicted kinase
VQKEKILILTVGLPRSGKSTWAKSTEIPMVNPDSIRLALHEHAFITSAEPYIWAIAKTMVTALFNAGHDVVIVDATNTTEERRNFWIDSKWKLKFMIFATSKEECLKRITPETAYLIPVIERMSETFTWPPEEIITWPKN